MQSDYDFQTRLSSQRDRLRLSIRKKGKIEMLQQRRTERMKILSEDIESANDSICWLELLAIVEERLVVQS